MGASVMPAGPTPQEIARVQANVAKMRAANAPEEDVLAYLQHEDSLSHAAPSTATPPTSDPTDISLRNLGRSFTQGATFGFGDEMGMVNRDADKAFASAHPVANFFARLAGGAVAPAAAMAAAPELLAGAGGAAMLGGAQGLLSGAGESEGGMADRAKGAAAGGLLGAAGGAAGYGIAKGVGSVASSIADRMHPERAVARAAKELLDPSVTAKLAQVDQIAPGGASVATAAVPPNGEKMSRFLPMLRAVGANPDAGASAEASFNAQKSALDEARKGLGAKMDAIQGTIPVTPKVQRAMQQVSDLLGPKSPLMIEGKTIPAVPDKIIPAPTTAQSPAPDLRTAVNDFWDRLGIAAKRSEGTVEQRMARTALERHATESQFSGMRGAPSATVIPGTPEKQLPPELDIQDLREALSRLRFMARQATKAGVNANGMTVKDITNAQNALRDVVYQHAPEFEQLDKPYAVVMDQLGRTDKALKTVQRSRANYQANDAYGTTSGSLGGSLPSGRHGVVMSVLDKILTDKAGAADATARLIATPGGPSMVDQLLATVPKSSTRGTQATTAATAAMIPAMRGLLFPQEQP